MAYEIKDNSGSVFKNQRKEKDSHPDLTGQAVINGVPIWVSAWTKQDRNGNKYLSLAFKNKETREDHQNERPSAQPAPKRAARADMDDEIPF